MEKGLLVEVYRSGPDCTNNGVTKHSVHCVLLGSEVNGPFEPGNGVPGLYLARWLGRLIAVPENLREKMVAGAPPRKGTDIPSLRGWMFGGNFVYTSDSRFPHEYPIPVYDRREF